MKKIALISLFLLSACRNAGESGEATAPAPTPSSNDSKVCTQLMKKTTDRFISLTQPKEEIVAKNSCEYSKEKQTLSCTSLYQKDTKNYSVQTSYIYYHLIDFLTDSNLSPKHYYQKEEKIVVTDKDGSPLSSSQKVALRVLLEDNKTAVSEKIYEKLSNSLLSTANYAISSTTVSKEEKKASNYQASEMFFGADSKEINCQNANYLFTFNENDELQKTLIKNGSNCLDKFSLSSTLNYQYRDNGEIEFDVVLEVNSDSSHYKVRRLVEEEETVCE